MRAWLQNWPRLVFIVVPVSIAALSGGVLIREALQSETDRSIRLVKESASRKEEFTVQQYLYSTVYHRKSRGEPIEIEDWRAEQPGGPGSLVRVEFSYTDYNGRHVMLWQVDLQTKAVSPLNEDATDLSWH
jgi:hypothetical protein